MDDDLLLRDRGKAYADAGNPAARPGAAGHDEWMIDEAIEESFPASDTPTPVRPGSLAAVRYAQSAVRRHRRLTILRTLMCCAAIAALLAAVSAVRGPASGRGT